MLYTKGLHFYKKNGDKFFMLANLIQGHFPSQERQNQAADSGNTVAGAVSIGIEEGVPDSCPNGKIVAYIHSHNVGFEYYGDDGVILELPRDNDWAGLYVAPQRTSTASSADRDFADSRNHIPNYWVDENAGGGFTSGHTHGNLDGHGH